MKVTMIKGNYIHEGKTYKAGDAIDIADKEANSLVSLGMARAADAEAEKPPKKGGK